MCTETTCVAWQISVNALWLECRHAFGCRFARWNSKVDWMEFDVLFGVTEHSGLLICLSSLSLQLSNYNVLSLRRLYYAYHASTSLLIFLWMFLLSSSVFFTSFLWIPFKYFLCFIACLHLHRWSFQLYCGYYLSDAIKQQDIFVNTGQPYLSIHSCAPALLRFFM